MTTWTDTLPGLQEELALTIFPQIEANPAQISVGVFVGRQEHGDVTVHDTLPLSVQGRDLTQLLVDDWNQVQEDIAHRFGSDTVVGWYVGRPGSHGRLTTQETRIHSRVFSRPGSFLLAIDSSSGETIRYGWTQGTMTAMRQPPLPVRQGRSARVYALGLFEVTPETGLPTVGTLAYTAAAGFAIIVLVWALALR